MWRLMIVKGNKYIIAAVLFVILGINLYSAFSNALNERKYEIGIKRAIGAGKKDIMMQFLTEGIILFIHHIHYRHIHAFKAVYNQ